MNWFSNLFKKKTEDDSKILFQGMDLNIWEYLGATKLTMDNYVCYVYFFMRKDDPTVREVRYVNNSKYFKVEEYHSFIHHIRLWLINENEIYVPICTDPSNYLKDYMLETFAVEWLPTDDNKKIDYWWKRSEKSQYQYNVNKQKKNIKEEQEAVITKEANIINFPKK